MRVHQMALAASLILAAPAMALTQDDGFQKEALNAIFAHEHDSYEASIASTKEVFLTDQDHQEFVDVMKAAGIDQFIVKSDLSMRPENIVVKETKMTSEGSVMEGVSTGTLDLVYAGEGNEARDRRKFEIRFVEEGSRRALTQVNVMRP